MKTAGRLLLAILLALGALPFTPATPARADSVMIYNIAARSNPSSVPPSEAPRLVMTSIVKGSGVFRDSYFNGVKAGFMAAAGWTKSETRNANDYLEFTITAANRFSIDYNSITYGLFVQDAGNPNDYKGPRTWEFRYSLDGFASSDNLLATHSVTSYNNSGNLEQTTYTTDLSSIPTTSNTVTFRLYGYYSPGSESGSAGGFAHSSGATYKPYCNWTGSGSNVYLDYTPIEVVANTAPVVTDFRKEGEENVTLELSETDFTDHYSDFNEEPMVTTKIVSLPAHGTLTLDGSNVTAGQEIDVDDLDDLDFEPDAGWSGETTFDWNGSDGGLYATSDATATLSLQAINDAPVNTVPGAQTVIEDENSAIGGISISDTDAGSGQLTTTLSVDHGTLTVATGHATVAGNGTASVTLDGTLTQINNTLGAAVTYRGALNYESTDTLTVVTNDNGNTGNGGAQSDTDTVSITVNGVQDAPTVSTFSDQTTEDTPLAFTQSDFTGAFSDVDAADSLQTVRIDALPAHGSLQLNGSDVSANQEIAAGDLGNLAYMPDTHWNGDDSFNWNGSDGTEYAAAGASVNISVTAENDAPVNTVPGAQTVDEDTDLVFSDSEGNTISISDVDAGANNVQTTLSVNHGVISVTLDLPGGVPAVNVTGNGTASVVLTNPVPEINMTLAHGVTYRPETDYDTTDTLTVETDDQGNSGGRAQVDSDTVDITINPLPDAPVVDDFGKTTDEDAQLAFSQSDFSSHFNDADTGDSMQSVRVDTLPAHGDLQLNGSDVTASQEIAAGDLGNLTYMPDTHWNGSDSFNWNGSDGGLWTTDNATITITVSAINDSPVNTVPGTQSVDEDTDLVFNVGGGNAISISDVDAGANDVQTTVGVDNGVITVTLDLPGGVPAGDVTGNGTATVVLAGSLSEINTTLDDGVTYRGAHDYNGADTLTMTTDDQGNTGAIGALSDTDTVNITIDPVPDAPFVEDFGKSADEDNSISFARTDFENHFSDGDIGDTLHTVRVDTLPAHGDLQLNGSDVVANQEIVAGDLGNLTYVPDTHWYGADTFDWNGSDGGLWADENATITLTINAVNDAPTVSNFNKSSDEDVPIDFTAGDFTSHTADVDPGDAVETVRIDSLPTHGTLTLDGAPVTLNQEIPAGQLNDLTYTPNLDWSGADTFGWNASDGDVYASAGATVNITVTAVNDAPINSVPGPQTVNEDADLVINGLSIHDTDAGGEGMSVELSVDHGELTVSGGAAAISGNDTDTVTLFGSQTQISDTLGCGVTYSSDSDYNGSDTLTMTTNDQGNTGAGGPKTDTDTVSITVTAVNDAPWNSVPGAQTVEEDAQLVFDNGNTISVADLDAGGGDVRVSISVTHGVLTLSQPTGLTFYAGTGTDDPSITFTGTLTDVNAALDGLTYQGDADYNGADTLTITSNDQGHAGLGGSLTDTDTVSIMVTAVNDAPVNTVPGPQQVNEETDLLITGMGVSDIDSVPGNIQVTLSVSHGTLTVSAGSNPTVINNGTHTVTITGAVADVDTFLSSGVTYRGIVDYFGPDTLTMTTGDMGNTGAGGPKTDTDTVDITVNNVNDAPVAVDDAGSTDEDTPLRTNTLANDTDADGDSLTVSAVTQGAFGEVWINSDSTVIYQPYAEYSGVDSFTYTASDGNGGECTATVTVTIDAVNDPPVAGDDQATTLQDTAYDITVLLNDSDMDGDALYITDTTEPAHGTAEFMDGGLIRYTPAEGYYGEDSFTYTITDGNEGFDTATVTVTVTRADENQPPPPPTSLILQQGAGGYFGMGDTYIDLGNPTTPYGNADRLRVKTTENADMLLRFNLEGLPAGTTILEATVRLFAIDHTGMAASKYAERDTARGSIPITLRAFPVLKEWSEAAATWYGTGEAGGWSAPGCQAAGVDYSPEYVDEVVAFAGAQTWVEFDITEAAQEWVDMPAENFGVVIKGYLHRQTVSYSFWSSQGPLSGLRPQLQIEYQLPY